MLEAAAAAMAAAAAAMPQLGIEHPHMRSTHVHDIRVQIVGWLVEDEDARVAHHGAGQANPTDLPTRRKCWRVRSASKAEDDSSRATSQ